MSTTTDTPHTDRTVAPRRTTTAVRPGDAGDTLDHRATDAHGSVAVRAPTAMDQLELRALAHRLGETVPAQPVVVAAVGGRVVAGLSVATGVVVFDGRDAGPAVRAALRDHAAR